MDDDAAIGKQPDRGVGQAGRRTGLQPERDAATATGRRRASPPDQLGGAADRDRPVAVGGGVAGDERVAGLGQVPQAQLERVDPEGVGGLVHARLDGPDLLWIPEAAERRRRRGVRQDAPGHDPHRRGQVRAARGVAALGHRPVRDVGVGPDEVVRLDVAEDEPAVPSEPGSNADLRGAAPDRLERLFERQHEPDRPAGLQRHEGDERFVLRVLLAAEPAARIRCEDAHLRERQLEHACDDALQPVRVLDRAPDGDPVAVRGGDERMRLDGELGDHREAVGAVDDDVGRRRGGIDIAPAIVVLAKDVRRRERVARAERRVLDERRVRREGSRDRRDRGQRLVLDPDETSGLLGGIEGLGGDRSDRFAVVVRLADRDHRPVAELRAEARDRLGQIRGGHRQADARDGEGRARVDRNDPRPGAVDRDELRVERPLQADVGDVDLATRHPVDAADAGRGVADAAGSDIAVSSRAHRANSSAASSTASKICS